jgi:C1A family cysteine protease
MREEIVMAQRQLRSFGWVRDLPDPRDRVFSAPMAVMQTLPDKVDLPEFPVYDQGRIGSCTANALAGAVQFDRIKNNAAPAFVPSRLFIYYNERSIEGVGKVGIDGGAQLRDGIKTLQKMGVCPDTDWSYDDTPAQFDGGPFPPNSKPAEKPSAAAYSDALKYKITTYQRLNQTLPQLQGCLAAGYLGVRRMV